MKKYFLIGLITLGLTSCEEELSVNNPTFEASKGYSFWRASKMQAFVKDGDLVIVGATDDENVTLYVDNYELGKDYELGKSNYTIATYTKVVDEVKYNYATSSASGKGFIKLDAADKQVPGKISGTFMVEMPASGTALPETPSVNFNKGVFFQINLTEVPVVTPGGDTPTTNP